MPGIFSRFIFNNKIFNTDGTNPTPAVLDGGFGDYHKKKYLKYLERIRNFKYNEEPKRKAVQAAKAIAKLPVKTPQIENIIAREPVDLEAFNKEIQIIQSYIASIQTREEQEADDEAAFLMLIA